MICALLFCTYSTYARRLEAKTSKRNDDASYLIAQCCNNTLLDCCCMLVACKEEETERVHRQVLAYMHIISVSIEVKFLNWPELKDNIN